jgi:hypothetical protein
MSLNELCKEYIIYMFSENDGGLLFQKLDKFDEEYLRSYLTEEDWKCSNEEEEHLIKSYTIKDWYEWNHKDEKLFTDCSELMKILHLLTHYYLEKEIDKNYGAIEYFEEMEMKILSDYLYYYISSNKDMKSLIRSLLISSRTHSFIYRSFIDLTLISLFYTMLYLIIK